jgi:hypothetical protein
VRRISSARTSSREELWHQVPRSAGIEPADQAGPVATQVV